MFKTEQTFKLIRSLGEELSKSYSLAESIRLISSATRELTGSDRVSVYLYDKTKDNLFTLHADGMKRFEVSLDKGICSYAFRQGELCISLSPYEDPNFYDEIDKKSGYKTKNVAAVPITNSKNEKIGVLQLLNIERGLYDSEDIEVMKFISKFIGSFLELFELEQIYK